MRHFIAPLLQSRLAKLPLRGPGASAQLPWALWAYDWSGFPCDLTVALVVGPLGAGPSTSVPPGTQSCYQDKLHPRPPTPVHDQASDP